MITDHVKNICKIGQAKECCRYLVAGEDGFECGKMDDKMKEILDLRVSAELQTGVADNCDGISDSNVLNINYENIKDDASE